MEMMEDDLFFADLSKQISLLIMDEEDGDVDVALALAPPWHAYPLQDMPYATATTPSTQLGRVQGQGQPPRHVQEKSQRALREISKGTGVFIPKFAQPSRKRSTFNHHHHHHHPHSSSHNPPINYSRPTNYHPHGHRQHDCCTTRRVSQEEESKANYFINPNRI